MGQRKGMPPRGDELKRRVAERLKSIEYRALLAGEAKRGHAHVFPAVHLDPPFRPEEER